MFSLGKMYTEWLLIEMSGTKRMKNKLGTRHLHQPPTTITIYILRHSVNGAAYLLSTILYAEYACGFKFPYICIVDEKTQRRFISLIIQRNLYWFSWNVTRMSWQSFAEKDPFSQPKSVISAKIRVELFGLILRLCTKCDESIVYKNLDITVVHCRAWRARAVSNSDI